MPTPSVIDLRTLDRHSDAAVTSLIPALSCRSCRPNAPFAELVQLARTSIADELRESTGIEFWKRIVTGNGSVIRNGANNRINQFITIKRFASLSRRIDPITD